MQPKTIGLAAIATAAWLAGAPAGANPEHWKGEWPDTDFSQHSIDYDEVLSGGPPKDGIPAIDQPVFMPVDAARELAPAEPVITVAIGETARAYPLRVMIWHEIVNDEIDGVPIAVTWCPLCNSSLVFDRRVEGRVLDFGTTGKLRHSDLIMYDRQTESWWQQFTGTAIVGAMLDRRLDLVPARVESLARFQSRFPDGEVLVPPDPEARDYGRNPYVGYDNSGAPFLYRGDYDDRIAPLERVISVDGRAWSLRYLMDKGQVEDGDLVLSWEPGQASPLDSHDITAGQDIGNVVVQRRTADGLVDVAHDISFAFAFFAFHPGAPLVTE